MDEYETRPWTVEVSGLVQKPKTYDLDDIMKMQLEERLYRHRCVEAWFMDVPWIGVPLHQLFSSNVNPKVPIHVGARLRSAASTAREDARRVSSTATRIGSGICTD